MLVLRNSCKYMYLFIHLAVQLIEETGCLLPCHFTEYRILEISSKNNGNYGLLIKYARNSLSRHTEQFVYDFVSLVGEAGGALGLFLGFNFLTLWDVFEWAWSSTLALHWKPTVQYP